MATINVTSVRETGRIVNAAASTLAITQHHDNKIITLNRALGVAVTLPAATGSGLALRFFVGTTASGGSGYVISVTGDDTMSGTALLAQDAADTAVMFETASDSDTITLNGSTKGGILGDWVELIDVAADKWFVSVIGSATGSEASPFSAAV